MIWMMLMSMDPSLKRNTMMTWMGMKMKILIWMTVEHEKNKKNVWMYELRMKWFFLFSDEDDVM